MNAYRYLQQMKAYKFLLFLFLTFIIAGCGYTNKETPDSGPIEVAVASIKIAPSAITLLSINETYNLSIELKDIDGNSIVKDVTWASSDPASISVDSNGELTAVTAVGSALITAEVDGIISQATFAIIAATLPNVTPVTDSQIVGNYQTIDSSAYLYQVTLTGISTPAVGSILFGSESLPLNGKVIEVDDSSGQVVVTLELQPLDQIFESLIIDQEFDLSKVTPVLTELAAEYYTLEHVSDGIYEATLKPDVSIPQSMSQKARGKKSARAATTETTFGPIECKTNNPTLPLSFSAWPASFTLDNQLRFILQYHLPGEEFKKVALVGSLSAKSELKPTLTAAFTGKIECEIAVATIVVRYDGVISTIIRPEVPWGFGAEIAGKFTVGQIGFEVSSELIIEPDIGFECALDGDCNMFNRGNITGKADAKWIYPSIENLDSQFRVQADAFGFAFLKLAVGSGIFTSFDFDAFEIKAGLKEATNLSTVEGQIANGGYQSDYKLTADLTGGLGGEAQSAFDLISINLNPLDLTFSNLLFQSPKADKVTVDWADYKAGDTIRFNVGLKPETLDYPTLDNVLGAYNVTEIIIYEVDPDAFGVEATELIRTSVTAGQQSIDLSWVADVDGDATNVFYAFVGTKALTPIPFIDQLQLGKAELLDSDNDDMPDGWELKYSLNPFDPADALADADGDELTNGDEYDNYTDPTERDSENDGMEDGWEVRYLLDPLSDDSALDPDMDGLTNLEEFQGGTNPLVPEGGVNFPRVLFTSSRSGNDQIYIMNTNGNNPLNLSLSQANDQDAAGSPNGSQLVFVSDRDGNKEIYSMNADTTNLQRLTNYAETDDDPVWSPDSSKIAFVRWIDNNREIFVMDADGIAPPIRLTNNAFSDSDPSWSPDGTSIVFRSDRTGNSEIFVMNADGTGPLNISMNNAYDGDPAWSPSGSQIAFVTNRDGNNEIYVMNTDGTSQLNRSNNTANDNNPSWSNTSLQILFDSDRDGNTEVYSMSSNGNNLQNLSRDNAIDSSPSWLQSTSPPKIAFETHRNGRGGIYLMDPNGTNVELLISSSSSPFPRYPAWSPDGSRLAYVHRTGCSAPGGRCDNIYIIDRDGSNAQRLTATLSDSYPAWSPDGSKIVFESARDLEGNTDIYIMNSDGSNPLQLTDDTPSFSSNDRTPDWSPDGTKIVFTGVRNGEFWSQIYIINPDGTGFQRLTNLSEATAEPVWSPDGSKIAFAHLRNNAQFRISVINADGSNLQELTLTTDPGGKDSVPSWSPDGSQIAFQRRLGGTGTDEIFIMNADGSNQVNITDNSGIYDVSPAWSK